MSARLASFALFGALALGAATVATVPADAGESCGTDSPCCKNATMGECPRETHRYGTAVDWFDDEDLARARAESESKLLLLLRISGDFHDPGKT